MKERKHYTAKEEVAFLRLHLLDEVAFLRLHLLDKVLVSNLCQDLGLGPTVFYRWQKESSRTERLPLRLRSVPYRQAKEE